MKDTAEQIALIAGRAIVEGDQRVRNDRFLARRQRIARGRAMLWRRGQQETDLGPRGPTAPSGLVPVALT